MFHKIRSVTPLENLELLVVFCEGITKKYNCKRLMEFNKVFNDLLKPNIFEKVKVDVGGYGILWNKSLDVSCNELFYHGETVESIFNGLIAARDATELWGLNESTLRKAISYGKLKVGIDVSKMGNQWIISVEAMVREYGEPKL